MAIGDNNGFGTDWGETHEKAEGSALSKRRSANPGWRVVASRCVDGDYQVASSASTPERRVE